MSVTALPITLDGLSNLLAVSRSSEEERIGRMARYGQEWELREWAREHDIEIIDLYRERGVKRDTPLLLRPLLIEAVNRVQNREAQGLLFVNQDRIGVHTEQLLETLDRAGGTLITVRDGILQPRRESEEQYITRLKEAVWTIEERHRTKLRAQAGRLAKAANGGWIGGNRLHPRYGQEIILGYLVPGREDYRPIPEQQAIIDRLIQADPRTGGQGWTSIANQLNTEGIPGPTGNPWRKDAALKIARREARIRNHQTLPKLPRHTQPRQPHNNVEETGALATRNLRVARARA